jgi:mannan endo-1,4-beta-mannosidase
LLAVSTLTPANAATANPNASLRTKSILNYLTGLPSKANERLIAGQWRSFGSVSTVTHQTIFDMTGEWLGLVGADYYAYYNSNTAMRVNTPGVNPAMIDYSNRGALIQIDAIFLHPVTGGLGHGDTISISAADYDAIMIPGTVPYNNYKAELDKVAAGFQELENNNVTVLFRPLMEMQGYWFWWGKQGTERYKKLWIYTFNYLTYTKGLNNLLWVYASCQPSSPAALSDSYYTNFYPGSAYVDVVGLDVYGYNYGKAHGYDALVATGKPFALTEFGLQGSDYGPGSFEPGKDLALAIESIKAHMPRTVYFMAWGGKWDVNKQLNVKAALTNPWVQNRPVPYGSAPAASPSPAPAPAPAPTPTPTTNTAPSVSLTSPANGSAFTAPANITLSANALDSNGSVSKVDFYRNGTWIGTDTASPYAFAWNSVAGGSYVLTAKATDNAGAVSTSSAVSITVTVPNTLPPILVLVPPTITAPTSGAILSGTSATVSWNSVSGAAGYLVRCEDLSGTTPLDTRNTWNGESFLFIDKYAATSITMKVVTGHAYRFWIHSAKSNFSYGDSTSWSLSVEVRFSMAATATSGLLVNFGATASVTTFGIPGWSAVIKDVYTTYHNAGPGGTRSGFNGGYDFQGVKGTARAFSAGQRIVVTWYNTSLSARTVTPRISMNDPDRVGWSTATGTWHSMSSVTVPALGTATSQFTFSSATAGFHSVVNVNVNTDYSPLVCDKIVLEATTTVALPTNAG